MIGFETPETAVRPLKSSDGQSMHDPSSLRPAIIGVGSAFDVYLDASRVRVRARVHRAADVPPERMFEANNEARTQANSNSTRDRRIVRARDAHETRRVSGSEQNEDVPEFTKAPVLAAGRAREAAFETLPDMPDSRRLDAFDSGKTVRLDQWASTAPVPSLKLPTSAMRPGMQTPMTLGFLTPAAVDAGARVSSPEAGGNRGQATTLAQDISQWLKLQVRERPAEPAPVKTLSIMPASGHTAGIKTDATEKSAAAATRAAFTPDEAQESETTAAAVWKRLITQMQFRNGQRTSSATMELDPPRLGPMRLDVQLSQGLLRVEVQTMNEEARDLLNQRLADLRVALAGHGVQLDEFRVSVVRNLSSTAAVAAVPQPRIRDETDRQKRQTEGERTLVRRDARIGMGEAGT